MSVIIDQVKCACSDCVCVVSVDEGVKRDGRIDRGEPCADHHKSGAGAGCACRADVLR